jgi:uncharacterized protein YacL
MNNLDDMKTLWHSAKTDSLPSADEMLQLIKKFRNQKLRYKWMNVIFALLLAILMTAAMVNVHFRFLTTYIGGSLTVIGALLLAATNLKSMKRFYQLDDTDNLKFLEFLTQTRKNQIYYYKKTMVWIVGLSVAGWILYMYELANNFPGWMIFIYLIMTIYLAILWFVIRPRGFRKDEEKINATREHVENILKQLK